MSKNNTSSLMFDERSINTTSSLPKLLRIVFYGLGITNEGYLERYHHFMRDHFRDKSRKEFSSQAASHRKTIVNETRNLTFKMLKGVILSMGWEIESISITVRDRLTGEEKSFSTSDTIDKLNKMRSEDEEIGIQSIV